MAVTWVEAGKLFPEAIKRLQHVRVLMDIGCGIRPQQFLRPLVHICCEPFGQYVEHLQTLIKERTDRNYVVIHATWAETVRLFPPKSVDTVVLNDVIEHLEKEEAVNLLRATERIARRQIALFTPLGFMPQSHPDGKDAWGLDGGAWQEHKSGWQPDDFDETWDIVAAEVFHKSDSMGNELEKPFGALWAIKTFDDELSTGQGILSVKQKMYSLVDYTFKKISKLTR